jgi:hypothetical protein
VTDDNEKSEFESRVRTALVESSDALDGRTRSRLNQARQVALTRGAQPVRQSDRVLWRYWAPAGTVAAAVLVMFLYAGQRNPVALTTASTASTTMEDIDLLADGDGFDLSADAAEGLDSDFYEWAAQTGITSSDGIGT